MIVATSFRPVFIIQFFLILCVYQNNYSMTWDNRNFPLFDISYNGSDSRHSFLDINGFFVRSSDAFRHDLKSDRDEQTVSIPELSGDLNLADIGSALELLGRKNPMPDDWLWFSDFKVCMPSSIEGQGASFAGYRPITNHIGIGGSLFVVNLTSLVHFIPAAGAVEKLSLKDPGNQALFTQTLQKFEEELGIKSRTLREISMSDVVIYISIFDTHEYRFKFRKLDWGVLVGAIIPSAAPRDIYNVASVPLGSEYGAWGWFVAPRIELELKEDFIFGVEGRFTQRMDKTFVDRIPVGNEQSLFAPAIGLVHVDSDPTWAIAPYFAFQDLRAGFGMHVRYTISHHDHDLFIAKYVKPVSSSDLLQPKLKHKSSHSAFTQEYATVQLVYDIAHDKSWDCRPMAYFGWDIPMNHLAGRGFAKTNRISIGCNFNF